ncbi:MAG TPA: methionine--tRNA ligase [Myxococcota bacterium]|nr:methionine--tRNA ligase [Myxococcota bacterium]
MSRTFYVTTPIYYANAEPHIGHTYTTVVADTLVRWRRLCGEDVFSVSGTDEHGEKMVEAAAKRGLDPAVFTATISESFQRIWAELGIAPSRFVRTTDPAHKRNVQEILQRVYDAGWIELREYEGLYCVGCERFLTERDLVNGLCRDHERPPEPRREVNYFFLMSREFAWLRRMIEEGADFIRPERYRNEALAMLRDESGLGDLSISRPKTRLEWGIELPFDRDHVCYVWFDALISYLTGAGYPDDPKFEARWASAEHLIGKDILKPHAVFWPIMLKAIGLEPPRHLRVHGYWNVDDRKVSKSLGNMVSPLAMRAKYGFESFRHYLLREMSFGLDANFSEATLVERVNADLANNLGNLVSRTLNLVDRFCGGTIPATRPLPPGALAVAEHELRQAAGSAADAVDTHVRAVEPHRALEAIFGLVSQVNRFVDLSEPWKAAKDPARASSVGPALAVSCEALRVIALLLAAFLPEAAQKIVERLGVPDAIRTAQLPKDARSWSQLPVGATVHKGDALFPRLEPLPETGGTSA